MRFHETIAQTYAQIRSLTDNVYLCDKERDIFEQRRRTQLDKAHQCGAQLRLRMRRCRR
jgi:hypothetical protein